MSHHVQARRRCETDIDVYMLLFVSKEGMFFVLPLSYKGQARVQSSRSKLLLFLLVCGLSLRETARRMG